jgi:DNA polymerase-3 subunit epsilon
MREIVFDTETTGVNPATGDRVVEIGCVELINRCPTGREYHAYFNPERAMPSEAEAVHGLSTIFLSDKPLFGERCEELLDFIGDAPLVAHNAGFDFGFLCTLVLARSRHPGAKHSLDALCSRFGVDRSQRVKHGALLDAQLLAQVYVELSGGRQIGLSLVAETLAPTIGQDQPVQRIVQRARREPRPHAPSLEELAAHAQFIAKLKEPLWAAYEPLRT